MRNWPPKIDLDSRDFAALDGKDFSVSEALAVVHPRLISYEDRVAIDDRTREVDRSHCLAIRPTALEVDFPVDLVVERAGEEKFFTDERFNHRAILVDVAFEAGPYDIRVIIMFCGHRPSAFLWLEAERCLAARWIERHRAVFVRDHPATADTAEAECCSEPHVDLGSCL
jgi:hypothetical protein